MQRVTASLAHGQEVAPSRFIAALASWGRNVAEHGLATDSWLVEATIDATDSDIVFARAEYARKAGHDLVLADALGERVFDLGSIVLGYVRKHRVFSAIDLGVGVRGAVNFIGEDLEDEYGSRTPWGGMVYVLLRPVVMTHAETVGIITCAPRS